MNTRLKLKLTKEEHELVREQFCVSRSVLYKVLTYQVNSAKAKRIREYVIKTLGHIPYVEEVLQ